MPYKSTLFDDFNDNSINATKWTQEIAGSTETGGRLNVPATAAYPTIYSQRLYDIRDGILAAKIYKTGTPTANTEVFIGLRDNSARTMYWAFDTTNASFWSGSDGGDVGGEVILDTTVGLGPSWVGGTWLGIGGVRYNGSNTDMMYLYKSTDGVTWTVMGSADIYGLTTSAVGIELTSGVWSGSSTLVMQYDDVTFFEYRSRVRVGGAWVNAKPKVRVGGAWVTARPVARSGAAWKPLR